MKNTEKKATARFKSTILLILATCVVIGLLSSTAVRLATATYLMQSSKRIETGNQTLDDMLNKPIDQFVSTQNGNQGSTDNQTPSTPSTPTTPSTPSGSTGSDNSGSSTDKPSDSGTSTEKPEDNTGDSSDDTSSDSGSSILDDIMGFIGSLTGGSSDDNSGEEVDEETLLKNNQEALKSYSDVLVSSKAAANRPGFTKTTSRGASLDFITSTFNSGILSEEAVVNYLAGDSVTVKNGTVTNELCLEDYANACIIGTDAETSKEAVEYSTKKIVHMGYIKNKTTGEIVHAYNKDKETGAYEYFFEYNADEYELFKEVEAVKLFIEFNDEVNPTPIDENGKTDSFIASVFPVLTGEQVRAAMCQNGITTVDLTYSDCSVELYYNIKTGEIYSLTQNINIDVAAKDGYLTLKGTISEVNKYRDFVY